MTGKIKALIARLSELNDALTFWERIADDDTVAGAERLARVRRVQADIATRINLYKHPNEDWI